MLRNTVYSFGTITKTFHWAIGLMIIGLLGLGLYMVRLDLSPRMFQLYGLHKSVGITVLTLAVLRVLWRLTNPPPASLPTHEKWEKTLAHLAHFLLYAAMFLMPLSGWLMSSAKGFSVSFFGLFTLPDVVKPDERLAEFLAGFHEYVAYGLIVLIGLHVAGALKHHVIDRDTTLRRMLPFGKIASVILALAVLPIAAQAADPKPAASWLIAKEASTIEFEGTQMGASFKGSFKQFGGTITFDPKQLEQSQANIYIDLASVDATSPDRTKYLATNDWFNTIKFPQAFFKTDSIVSALTADNYLAKGKLTIRETTLPVEMPFKVTIKDNKAMMEGTLTIKRLDYGLGKGQWADPNTIGPDVKINVKINAVKKPLY